MEVIADRERIRCVGIRLSDARWGRTDLGHRPPSDHQTALPLHVPFVLGLPAETLMVPTGPNEPKAGGISTVHAE